MLNALKKGFNLDDDVYLTYPSASARRDALAKHCAARGWSYEFTGEDADGNPLATVEGVPSVLVVKGPFRYGYQLFCREV